MGNTNIAVKKYDHSILTKEWWEGWKFGQTDESHCFSADECTDKEDRDAKQVTPWKTFILGDGPHHSKEHSCQKDWRGYRKQSLDYYV